MAVSKMLSKIPGEKSEGRILTNYVVEIVSTVTLLRLLITFPHWIVFVHEGQFPWRGRSCSGKSNRNNFARHSTCHSAWQRGQFMIDPTRSFWQISQLSKKSTRFCSSKTKFFPLSPCSSIPFSLQEALSSSSSKLLSCRFSNGLIRQKSPIPIIYEVASKNVSLILMFKKWRLSVYWDQGVDFSSIPRIWNLGPQPGFLWMFVGRSFLTPRCLFGFCHAHSNWRADIFVGNPSITTAKAHGRFLEVFHAPFTISPLCCRILLLGFIVKPMYVAFEKRGFLETTR